MDTNDTYKEMSSILSKVLEIAGENNAGLISTGAHPFAMYEDQVITDVNPRYQEFADKYGWAVRRLLTFGMHVRIVFLRLQLHNHFYGNCYQLKSYIQKFHE